jgi:hypothetical protein
LTITSFFLFTEEDLVVLIHPNQLFKLLLLISSHYLNASLDVSGKYAQLIAPLLPFLLSTVILQDYLMSPAVQVRKSLDG